MTKMEGLINRIIDELKQNGMIVEVKKDIQSKYLSEGKVETLDFEYTTPEDIYLLKTYIMANIETQSFCICNIDEDFNMLSKFFEYSNDEKEIGILYNKIKELIEEDIKNKNFAS